MTAERSLTPSSLARFAGRTASTPDDIHRIGAAAWHKQGFYGECVDEIDDEWLKQALINRASRRFGKRINSGPRTQKDVTHGSR